MTFCQYYETFVLEHGKVPWIKSSFPMKRVFIWMNTIICIIRSKSSWILFMGFLNFWNHRIKSLIANISPSFNLIKMLLSTYWGGDPLILSILYKFAIRSKLDYGSALYGSVSKNHLHHIERFHNTCIRLIIKAFFSTPTSALCVETKIPPLFIQKEYLASRFIIHYLPISTSPITSKIRDIIQRWRFIYGGSHCWVP